MKNDMKLIMENWRGSAVKEQRDPHSNDWISETTVGKFLEALKEENNDVLNSKVIERGISAGMKKYANEIAALEGEPKKKLNALIGKVSSQDSIDYLADAAVAGSEKAVKAGIATVSGLAMAAGTPVGWVVLGSMITGFVATKVIKAVTQKGIKIATDIGGALEDLDVPDQDLANEPALNLIDISDDYKKVIVGADGKLDKQEAAVLAIGFKSVALAFNKIKEKQATIEAMPNSTVQEAIDKMTALRALLTEPMTAYMDNTATEAARKAYSKMLKLQRNVTITQN